MIPYRACSSLGSLLILMIMLTSCSGPTVATRPTPTPAGTATPAATATALPPTDTPTVVPTATTPPPTGTPTVVPTATATATATPAAETSAPDETSALTFRTIPTSDGFVAVREQPTTDSSEITRLTAGSAVVCTGFVAGESLLFGGQYSDRWAECPSVGGYIFGPLLSAEDAPGVGEPHPPPRRTTTPRRSSQQRGRTLAISILTTMLRTSALTAILRRPRLRPMPVQPTRSGPPSSAWTATGR